MEISCHILCGNNAWQIDHNHGSRWRRVLCLIYAFGCLDSIQNERRLDMPEIKTRFLCIIRFDADSGVVAIALWYPRYTKVGSTRLRTPHIWPQDAEVQPKSSHLLEL